MSRLMTKLTKWQVREAKTESSLGAQSFCWFCHAAAHMVYLPEVLALKFGSQTCSRRSFGSDFGFPYMFYTFKLLHQFEKGRSKSDLLPRLMDLTKCPMISS